MDGDLAAGEGVGVGARLPYPPTNGRRVAVSIRGAGRKCRAARGEMRRARFARAEGVGLPEGEARAAKRPRGIVEALFKASENPKRRRATKLNSAPASRRR